MVKNTPLDIKAILNPTPQAPNPTFNATPTPTPTPTHPYPYSLSLPLLPPQSHPTNTPPSLHHHFTFKPASPHFPPCAFPPPPSNLKPQPPGLTSPSHSTLPPPPPPPLVTIHTGSPSPLSTLSLTILSAVSVPVIPPPLFQPLPPLPLPLPPLAPRKPILPPLSLSTPPVPVPVPVPVPLTALTVLPAPSPKPTRLALPSSLSPALLTPSPSPSPSPSSSSSSESGTRLPPSSGSASSETLILSPSLPSQVPLVAQVVRSPARLPVALALPTVLFSLPSLPSPSAPLPPSKYPPCCTPDCWPAGWNKGCDGTVEPGRTRSRPARREIRSARSASRVVVEAAEEWECGEEEECAWWECGWGLWPLWPSLMAVVERFDIEVMPELGVPLQVGGRG